MRIKEGFILKSVAGENVIIATGKAAIDLNGIIRLNESGAFLWKQMASDVGITEAGLIEMLVNRYHIDDAVAANDVSLFLASLASANCIAE